MVGGTPASSKTKIGRHDIAEILMKVALKHQKLKKKSIYSQLGGGDLKFQSLQKKNHFVRNHTVIIYMYVLIEFGHVFISE